MRHIALRHFIREALTAKDAEKLVGKYLWPAERGLDVDEPNTAYEDKLFDALTTSIADNQKRLSSDKIQALFDLAGTGKYSDILKLKKRGKVYRGVNVTREWFESSFGLKISEVLKQKPGPPIDRIFLPYRLPDDAVIGLMWGKPGEANSWSTKLDQTAQFAMGMAGEGNATASTMLILESDASNGDFLDYKPFYNLEKRGKSGMWYARRGEAEVVSLGQVSLTGAHLLASKYGIEEEEKDYVYLDAKKKLKTFRGTPEEVDAFRDKMFTKAWGRKFNPLRRSQKSDRR